MERDKTLKDIIYGGKVGFCELNPKHYWDAYEGMRIGVFKGQYQLPMPEVGIMGDLIIEAVHPEPIPLTPEQEHLLRPPDTREGRRQAELLLV